MELRTKFTIVIPTRDRAFTLASTLRTCLDQTYPHYEIIVSDNCSTDNTKAVVTSNSDPRLRYIKTPTRVSMAGNFEFALSHVSTGYVVVIGDDDAVMPECLFALDAIIQETKTLAVTSGIATYTWPNHADVSSRNKAKWEPKTGYEIRSTKEWIKKFLRFDFLYTMELPGVYCSCIDISVVQNLKKGGVFFRSQTPDSYAAITCSSALTFHVHSFTPFVVQGASRNSTGSSQLEGTDKTEARKFEAENTIPFHPRLVYSPSYTVIATDSLLNFLDAFPEKQSEYQFDFARMLAKTRTEVNENNRGSLVAAIEEMATRNGVDLGTLPRLAQPLWKRPFVLLGKIVAGSRLLLRYSSVANLRDFGVNDVSHAAHLIDFAIKLNQRKKLARLSDYYLGLFVGHK